MILGDDRMLKTLKPRKYQVNIVESVLKKGNTLVVLPTGLGKTLIALMLIDKLIGKGKILFMAPTRPLAEQHYNSIVKHLDVNPDDVVLITGAIQSKKRKMLWNKKIIVATPQTVRNDLMNNQFDLKGFSMCVIDEAHRSIGNYAYTFVAKRCLDDNVLILGLTASPGGDKKKIESILDSLSIKNVEIRGREDIDVKPYVKKVKISWIKVELKGDLRKAVDILRNVVRKYTKLFRTWGFRISLASKKNLLSIKSKIDRLNGGSKYTLLSHYTTFFNLVHMLELLETQGVKPFLRYVEKLRLSQSKAAKRIVNSKELAEIIKLVQDKEHPKMKKLLQVVEDRKDKKMIVFVQYRERLNDIVKMLKQNGLHARSFIGQRKGMSQEVQKKAIQDFREDKFNIMVSTSIGEEGLDIPAVDTVIFYEPIPSEIRSIQRRGRTGRSGAGEVIILMTTNTQDEAFYWSSLRKEKRMRAIMRSISSGKIETDKIPKRKSSKRKQSKGKSPIRKPPKKKHGMKKIGQSKITEFL